MGRVDWVGRHFAFPPFFLSSFYYSFFSLFFLDSILKESKNQTGGDCVREREVSSCSMGWGSEKDLEMKNI